MNSLLGYLNVYEYGMVVERIISRERLLNNAWWIEISCGISILFCSYYIVKNLNNVPPILHPQIKYHAICIVTSVICMGVIVYLESIAKT